MADDLDAPAPVSRVERIYTGRKVVQYAVPDARRRVTVRVGEDGVFACMTCPMPHSITCRHVEEAIAFAATEPPTED